MKKLYYPRVCETVYEDTLSSGLRIVVVPKAGHEKKYAYLAANFGSIDRAFLRGGKAETVPMGIAHFLEHKLFDMPDYDVSEAFSLRGASPNAFTSYDITAYHFSCTEHFDECLKILLEFVGTGYFTEASVQKELGIIGQEIDMADDEPDSRCFEMLMENMYASHPVRERILGTHASIAQITPEMLRTCHSAFYRPDNMLLCVVGDVDPDEVRRIAAEAFPERSDECAEAPRKWQEDMTCRTAYSEQTMSVAKTMFQLGFKCEPLLPGMEGLRQEAVGGLAAEALFGETSPLYLRLYRQGLIDYSFGGGFENLSALAFLSIGGDTENPEAVRDAILQAARQIAADGIGQDALSRLKRASVGRHIRAMDNFASVCAQVCMYGLSGYDYFRTAEPFDGIRSEDIQEFIGRVITPERMSTAIIRPSKEEES